MKVTRELPSVIAQFVNAGFASVVTVYVPEPQRYSLP
jgi:hypothetical protein